MIRVILLFSKMNGFLQEFRAIEFRLQLKNYVEWDMIFTNSILILHKDKNEVEIAYLGLLEEYQNKKLGSYLLSAAIKNSFKEKPKRVWVHTCSLDHKNALNNYKNVSHESQFNTKFFHIFECKCTSFTPTKFNSLCQL